MNITVLKRRTQTGTLRGTGMGGGVSKRNSSLFCNVFTFGKKNLFLEFKMNRFSVQGSSKVQCREAWNVLALPSL